MGAPWHQMFVHLVWSTRERKPMITQTIETRVHAALAAKALELRCPPVAIGGTRDHVHMLVRMHPDVPVSRLVGQVKGSSAHLVNAEMCPTEHFGWQGGYGAFTLARASIESVRDYVLNQPDRHRTRRLEQDLEQVDVLSLPGQALQSLPAS